MNTETTGRLTLPTDVDMVDETIRLKICWVQMPSETATEPPCPKNY